MKKKEVPLGHGLTWEEEKAKMEKQLKEAKAKSNPKGKKV